MPEAFPITINTCLSNYKSMNNLVQQSYIKARMQPDEQGRK